MSTNNLTTIEEDFADYFRQCYPKGTPEPQKVEIRQAFLAGVLTAIDKPAQALLNGQPGTDNQAVAKLARQWRSEVVAALTARQAEMGQRN